MSRKNLFILIIFMKKKLPLSFKTILFSLLLLCCTSQTFASHFRYGNVSWRRISETPTTVTIGVTVNISWRAFLSDPITFKIENGALSDGATSFTIVPTNTTDPVGGWINSNGYTEITLNKSIGITTLRYRGGNKISTSVNNAGGYWNVFTTINTSASGNAPVSAMPAVINMPVGVPNALYNMSASDPDPGTVLTYRFATALEDNASVPPGLSIDANTGQLTFDTVGKTVGELYNVLVVVTDNDGNSVLIDFLINIIQGSTAPDWDYSVTPADNAVYNIVVGEQLSFKLKSTDSDVGSTVKIGVSGLPNYIDPSLVFTPNLPAQGNLQSESVFTWTPTATASGKSFILNFLAQDDTGMGTNSSVLIKVNSEVAPVFVAPTPYESSIRQIMPGDVFSDVIKAKSTIGSLTSIVYATYPSGASLDKTVPTQGLDPSEVVVNWVSTAANFGPNVFEFQVAIAADPSIFTSRKYTVVVNTPSFFESTALTTAFVGQKYSYAVNINDIDIVNGDQIELDGVTIPSWLTLVKQSEKIYLLEGTPSLGDVGLNAVSLQAEDTYHHDPSSDHVFQNFDINVKIPQAATHLSFDGVNDYVNIPKNFNSNFTIEFMMKTSDIGGSGNQWYHGKGIIDQELGGVANDFGISLINNKVAFGIGNPDVTIFSTSDVNTNSWNHIAVSWDQTTGAMNLSVNGVLESVGTGSINSRNAGSIMRIGAMNTLVSYFSGNIDEVRIWNRALSQAEIVNNMNCELPTPTTQTGLLAYYQFNQGVGATDNAGATSLTDASANANHGTLNNFALTGAASNWVAGSPIVTGTNCPYIVPTITVTDINKTYGDVNFDLEATSNSQGVITYSIEGVNTTGTTLSGINNKTVNVGNAGSLTIRATQAADGIYASETKDITVTIGKATLTVTADTKSKVYGDADPALTYQVTLGVLKSGDVFTGSLSRTAGENVADYAISAGTVSAGANYNVSFVPANLSITPKAITITADTKSKVYGNADPALTYQVTLGVLKSGDVFTGSLSRSAGENVANYAISAGTVSAGANYNVSFVPANLSITPKAITITADTKSKVYGDVDPALTYQAALVGTDVLTGSLTRAAGENVGSYAISSTLTNNNYNVTFVPADVTITKKSATVTADAKSKVYGDVDPALTYQAALVGTDVLTGSLTRAAGENVGNYAISSTLTNNNYNITFVPADVTITKKSATVTADAKSKVYGDVDPALTYQAALVGTDVLTGSLARAAGENVGSYAISSTLTNNNYNITFVPANIAITKKPVTVTADAKSKVYGGTDPALTYQTALVGTDVLTGSLTRAAGENVGSYAISSTLTNNNYNITFVPANVAITKKSVTVTADAKSKVYGGVDPALTYQTTLVGIDVLTGSLTRAAGENVGSYAISSTLTNNNYNITFVPANIAITKKSVTVTADSKSKVYGDIDPALTYQAVLLGTDVLTGSLIRAAGENVGVYTISSTLTNDNYDITFVPADVTIIKKAVTVAADAKSKVYGGVDPALTYQVVLVGADVLTGSLTRAAGENVGVYTISSTLTNDNYDITFVPADVTIIKKAVTVTADAKSKVYGDVDPALTYTVSPSLLSGGSFTGILTRAVGENVGTYAIGQGNLSAGSNYTISYNNASFVITKADQVITWNQVLESGCDGGTSTVLTASTTSGLPLSFASSNTNVASVSNGVLAYNNFGSATITASQSGDGNYNAAQAIVLPVLYTQPNLIRKHFDDVIFFDNSSKSFKSYSWYKNGLLVPGQTAQYFKDNGVLNGVYYAMTTKVDGTVITTCPLTFSPSVEVEYLKIAPNPVGSNSVYQIISNVDPAKLQNARVTVFDMLGALITDKVIGEKTVDMIAPSAEGIYIVKLTLASGKYFTKNLLVKN
jgi:phage-related holin